MVSWLIQDESRNTVDGSEIRRSPPGMYIKLCKKCDICPPYQVQDFCNHQLRRDVSQIHPKMSPSFSLRFLSLETQGDWTRGSASEKLEDPFPNLVRKSFRVKMSVFQMCSAKSLTEPTASPVFFVSLQLAIGIRDFKESDLPFCAQQLGKSPRTCADSQWNVWRSCIAIGRGWVKRKTADTKDESRKWRLKPFSCMDNAMKMDGWQAVRHLPYLQTLDVSRNRIAYQAKCFDVLFFVDIWWRISWNLSQPWFSS